MNLTRFFISICAVIACCSCSGGGGDSGRAGGSSAADFACDGACPNLSLSAEEVSQITSQAVAAASARSVAATIAVVDRVGNLLGVYQMSGAVAKSTITSQTGAVGGFEGISVPATLAALSKAGTGAFLSSQGNAFSTRTASQIVQEHFDPGERSQPGGPLFGVQFSQLPCGDILRPGTGPAPHALPLGLAADPGGIPLYKQGDLVGGLGVEIDGVYRLDVNIRDTDDDVEERVAMAGSIGFEAPSERIAPNVNVGKSLRYTDLSYDEIEVPPSPLPALDPHGFQDLGALGGTGPRAGAVFGTIESGVLFITRAGLPAMTLVNGDGSPRFPTRGGSPLGGSELKVSEVDALLDSALLTAYRARAAIRRPLDTSARVSIWVIDQNGTPLGFTRSADAPVFGIDVSLQKARTAAFLSSSDAGSALMAAGFGEYVNATQAVLGPSALLGIAAYGERSIGNLARPFFPDGIQEKTNGPLSLPFPGTPALAGTGSDGRTWSIFNTGLQLDVAFGQVAQALTSISSGGGPAVCAGASIGSRLGNGMQIFPGGVPLYRGKTLIGAVGVSGDGIDQDDLVAFYGSSRAGLDAAGHVGVGDPVLGFNAPIAIRADQLAVALGGVRLRYVNCPEGPFRGENEQNVCDKL